MNIHGKRAVVTGAAMGIGFETARRLMAEGCTVTIWDLDEESLKRAVGELGGTSGSGSAGGEKVFGHVCDVTNPDRVKELAETAVREMGGVDILVNNAGYLAAGNFLDKPADLWAKTMDVNVNALFHSIHAFLPAMYERNSGHIVNISSAAGVLGVPGLAAYSASKWAVLGLTEALRHEALNLGKTGVRFSSIHPSYVASGLFAGARLRGLGGLIVPPIPTHDVVAEAIVEGALKKGKSIVFRPRSVRTAPLLRGILPERLFRWFIRFLNVHTSMSTWKGRTHADK